MFACLALAHPRFPWTTRARGSPPVQIRATWHRPPAADRRPAREGRDGAALPAQTRAVVRPQRLPCGNTPAAWCSCHAIDPLPVRASAAHGNPRGISTSTSHGTIARGGMTLRPHTQSAASFRLPHRGPAAPASNPELRASAQLWVASAHGSHGSIRARGHAAGMCTAVLCLRHGSRHARSRS